MSETPEWRTEEQLLAQWLAAELRLSRVPRGAPDWEAAAAEEWRANIAYRQVVMDRLQREQQRARDTETNRHIDRRRRSQPTGE
jgi:hypothetical protein